MILFNTHKPAIFRGTNEEQPFDCAVDQGETHNLWDIPRAVDVKAARLREMINFHVESAVRTRGAQFLGVSPPGESAWQ